MAEEKDDIRRILSMNLIAVVGLSRSPEKDSYVVASYLQKHGNKNIPVNPSAATSPGAKILGEKVYAKLKDIPKIEGAKVEVIDIFRPSADVPPIVDSAIAIGAKAVWMQLGIINEEAARNARKAGLLVVQDRCMRVEHSRMR